MLKRAGGLDFIYVPYPGGGPTINALLGNHIIAVLAEYAPLAGHINAGKFRTVAVTSKARVAWLPDIPTVAETYKDFEVDFWWGLFSPAKTPQATVNQLTQWFTAALAAPELKARLAALGFFPSSTCGADFAALLRKQYDQYGRVIGEAKIRVD